MPWVRQGTYQLDLATGWSSIPSYGATPRRLYFFSGTGADMDRYTVSSTALTEDTAWNNAVSGGYSFSIQGTRALAVLGGTWVTYTVTGTSMTFGRFLNGGPSISGLESTACTTISYMFYLDSSTAPTRIYAYFDEQYETLSREASRDITTSGHSYARSRLVSDGTTLWLFGVSSNGLTVTGTAWTISTRARDTEKDFSATFSSAQHDVNFDGQDLYVLPANPNVANAVTRYTFSTLSAGYTPTLGTALASDGSALPGTNDGSVVSKPIASRTSFNVPVTWPSGSSTDVVAQFTSDDVSVTSSDVNVGTAVISSVTRQGNTDVWRALVMVVEASSGITSSNQDITLTVEVGAGAIPATSTHLASVASTETYYYRASLPVVVPPPVIPEPMPEPTPEPTEDTHPVELPDGITLLDGMLSASQNRVYLLGKELSRTRVLSYDLMGNYIGEESFIVPTKTYNRVDAYAGMEVVGENIYLLHREHIQVLNDAQTRFLNWYGEVTPYSFAGRAGTGFRIAIGEPTRGLPTETDLTGLVFDGTNWWYGYRVPDRRMSAAGFTVRQYDAGGERTTNTVELTDLVGDELDRRNTYYPFVEGLTFNGRNFFLMHRREKMARAYTTGWARDESNDIRLHSADATVGGAFAGNLLISRTGTTFYYYGTRAMPGERFEPRPLRQFRGLRNWTQQWDVLRLRANGSVQVIALNVIAVQQTAAKTVNLASIITLSRQLRTVTWIPQTPIYEMQIGDFIIPHQRMTTEELETLSGIPTTGRLQVTEFSQQGGRTQQVYAEGEASPRSSGAIEPTRPSGPATGGAFIWGD